MNIAWSRDADDVLGTHNRLGASASTECSSSDPGSSRSSLMSSSTTTTVIGRTGHSVRFRQFRLVLLQRRPQISIVHSFAGEIDWVASPMNSV
jgi:hypothetical protein